MAKYTPMIEQYLDIKSRHKDAILFFRLGDFYEMFFDDALTASRELEIVLTSRDGGENKVPMCGIPYHSANLYIGRLVNRGYKVAVCEQTEDPAQAKGIVKREVIKIVTPGTVLDDSMLEENRNNYLAAVIEHNGTAGLAYTDISTGEFMVTEITGEDTLTKLESELHRISPAECLVQEWSELDYIWQDNHHLFNHTAITHINEEDWAPGRAEAELCSHFGVATLEGFGLKAFSSGIIAAAVIIKFLKNTQKASLKQIRSIRTYTTGKFLDMDYSTRRNLELTETIRDNRRDGSLLSVIDNCLTAMGKRMMRNWVEQPLRDLNEINFRLDTVEEFKDNLLLRSDVRKILPDIYDLERLAGKLGAEIATPRDLLALKSSISQLGPLHSLLTSSSSEILRCISQIDLLEDIYLVIDKAIDEEAPLAIKEGNIIKAGFSEEIDELKEISNQGSGWLIAFEQREKERTGIKNLKVGFNKVFGYYIEITRSNLALVPPEYHRKQTLVNAERFICEELKNYEDKILNTREKLYSLEYEEFIKLRESLGQHINRIQETAAAIALLDVLSALAEVAYNNNYVRPCVDNNSVIEIKSGRHPVVEKNLIDARFVPNDIYLDNNDFRFAIITGPNMGGKSTFMRQVALLVLMAQMGSFVPADSARIGVVDKIFTRVGASDDLAAGQSTFMVEMVETANILHNATRHSLVILDEIGRGTSTYDGLSIARSVSEYILSHIGCKTLFATHYHELTSLAEDFTGVVNLCVSVKESGDNVVFLKKVLNGKADKSYGIHVARLAGLPNQVIERARHILTELEQNRNNQDMVNNPSLVQLDLFQEENPILAELRSVDLDSLTPREALLKLYEWKEKFY